MPLSRFPSVMPRAAEAVLSAAAALRYVRDSGGDLPWHALHRVQDGLAQAKAACLEALAEGQKQPASADAFMAAMGGPATLTDFAARMAEVEAAASAWNGTLSALLADLSAAEVVALIRRGEGMAATRHIEFVPYLTGARADALRQSQALAALIAAFEAVGA